MIYFNREFSPNLLFTGSSLILGERVDRRQPRLCSSYSYFFYLHILRWEKFKTYIQLLLSREYLPVLLEKSTFSQKITVHKRPIYYLQGRPSFWENALTGGSPASAAATHPGKFRIFLFTYFLRREYSKHESN